MKITGQGIRGATAASHGGVRLAGDLAGEGSTYTTPRVGSITGTGGTVSIRAAAKLSFDGGQTEAAPGDAEIRMRGGAITQIAFRAASVGNTAISVVATDGSDNITIGQATVVPRLKLSALTAAQVTGGVLELGTSNLAASGAIRVANGTTILVARNATNTQDLSIVGTSGNAILFGSSGASQLTFASGAFATFDLTDLYLRDTSGNASMRLTPVVGGANVASAGLMRVPNNVSIVQARNFANTANMEVLTTNASDDLRVGGAGVVNLTMQTAGSTRFNLSTTVGTLFVPLVLQGSNPSTTGDIRAVFANGGVQFGIRNEANSADMHAISTHTGGVLRFAGSGVTGTHIFGGEIYLAPSGSTSMYTNTTSILLYRAATSFGDIVASPILAHQQRQSDAACTTLTIRSQQPFATATGTNRNPGNLTLEVPAPVAGGAHGTLALSVSAATGLAISHSGSAAQIAFLGATPIARPAAYTQTYATTSRTVNAYTPDAESTAYTGQDNLQAGAVYAKVVDLNALRVAVENLRAMAENQLNVKTQMIDDLQAYGLFG